MKKSNVKSMLKIIRRRYSNSSREEIIDAYFRATLDSLGSCTERMYELGYDIVDIEEQEQAELDVLLYSDAFSLFLLERGIDEGSLWVN